MSVPPYIGYRYYKQKTRGMGIPTYSITPQYLKYLHTLPPTVAMDKLDDAAAWINAKNKKTWLRNKRKGMYGQWRTYEDYLASEWAFTPMSGSRIASWDPRTYKYQYNTHNHQPKHYY